MNRSLLLVALLGLMASPLVHADEPSVCTSVCASEKQQCTSRAGRLTGFDKLPPVEEKNQFARVANHGQVESVPARAAEQSDFHKRKRERLDACDASYRSCTRACAPTTSSIATKAVPKQ
ncbi:hypothetical protein [Massilia sp. LC238]|uniref:hypothetical protein n=1 Tax=Massilia sp. LC238 TaxID=1502852 RepID=UPI0004E2F676|nr:hypothetical protein [Massilia sp. LC238]KFC73732.1 hypothetical protein FG94_01512 [Massilia sp. LC238]